MKNYIIDYMAKDKKGNVLKSGKIRVKNKDNEFVAQVEFEKYLQRNYPNFGQLIVNSCVEDNMVNQLFEEIFSKK